MKITPDLSDTAVIKELGKRLARRRIHDGLSQDTLAEESGLSRNPVTRLEGGESIQLASFIRMLRMLRLLDNLDGVAPEHTISPVQLMAMRGKERRRAPRQRSRPANRPAIGQRNPAWKWGDE